MIITFADKNTYELYIAGKSKRFEYINLAYTIDDLKVPPGNKLHQLEGSRKGQFAISVNEQWRICFRFIDGDAYDVELTDYH